MFEREISWAPAFGGYLLLEHLGDRLPSEDRFFSMRKDMPRDIETGIFFELSCAASLWFGCVSPVGYSGLSVRFGRILRDKDHDTQR